MLYNIHMIHIIYNICTIQYVLYIVHVYMYICITVILLYICNILENFQFATNKILLYI